ncbi:probable E3 ubiquitin-protein ligase HIP1 [Asparagus officinalis]|nr:probable E3 ubiquitin-protein ligase HIP1 [Asparagus officinalis]
MDFPSIEMPRIESGPSNLGQLRRIHGGHRRSPAEFDEVRMFQTRVPQVFLDGVGVYDQYNDLRLDVDNMSYEELLELSEKIGYVSTGLREEEILSNLRKQKHSFPGASPSQKERKCTICQEEYEANDEMGRLQCGHSYHTYCIKQWLLRKNTCPVCKTAMSKS